MSEPHNPDAPIEVPYSDLSEEALSGIVEAYVLSEGTDYGHQEVSFEKKVEQVLAQLRKGKAKIVFDPNEESCVLVPS